MGGESLLSRGGRYKATSNERGYAEEPSLLVGLPVSAIRLWDRVFQNLHRFQAVRLVLAYLTVFTARGSQGFVPSAFCHVGTWCL